MKKMNVLKKGEINMFQMKNMPMSDRNDKRRIEIENEKEKVRSVYMG